MRIINDYDIITPAMQSATDVFLDLAPVLGLVAGILLGMWVIEMVIDYFEEPSITIRGKRLTQSSINSDMPMSWFHSLSSEERKSISDFDHEQARKKYTKMTQ